MKCGYICGWMFTGIVSLMESVVGRSRLGCVSSICNGSHAVLLGGGIRSHGWHTLVLIPSEVWGEERIDSHVPWRSPQAVANVGRPEGISVVAVWFPSTRRTLFIPEGRSSSVQGRKGRILTVVRWR